MGEPVIAVRGLRKSLADKEAVAGIDLAIAAGSLAGPGRAGDRQPGHRGQLADQLLPRDPARHRRSADRCRAVPAVPRPASGARPQPAARSAEPR